MPKVKNGNLHRHTSPSFVSGFKAAQTSSAIIIDFITAMPDEPEAIFDSVALTRDVAENLMNALGKFLESNDDQEN